MLLNAPLISAMLLLTLTSMPSVSAGGIGGVPLPTETAISLAQTVIGISDRQCTSGSEGVSLADLQNLAQQEKYVVDETTGGISTGDPLFGAERAFLSENHGEEGLPGGNFSNVTFCDDTENPYCEAKGQGRKRLNYGDSYIEAFSNVKVWWYSNHDKYCNSEADTYVNVEGEGSISWFGVDPAYDADTAAIKIELYAEGFGIDSISVNLGFSSRTGASGGGSAAISEQSSSRIVYEGTYDDVWQVNFAYNGGRIYDGHWGSVTQVHQGVSGTFSFDRGGGVIDVVQTQAWGDADL